MIKLVLKFVNFIIHNLLILAIVIAAFVICKNSENLSSLTNVNDIQEATWLSVVKLIGLTWLISVIIKNFSLYMIIAILGIIIMLAAIGFALPAAAIFSLVPSCMLGPVIFTILVLYYWFVC